MSDSHSTALDCIMYVTLHGGILINFLIIYSYCETRPGQTIRQIFTQKKWSMAHSRPAYTSPTHNVGCQVTRSHLSPVPWLGASQI